MRDSKEVRFVWRGGGAGGPPPPPPRGGGGGWGGRGGPPAAPPGPRGAQLSGAVTRMSGASGEISPSAMTSTEANLSVLVMSTGVVSE